MQGHYQARDNKMTAYLDIVKKLIAHFQECIARQVPRGENSHANALANLGLATKTSTPKVMPVVYLQWRVVWKEEGEQIVKVAEDSSWMTPIIDYLQNNTLPADKNEA